MDIRGENEGEEQRITAKIQGKLLRRAFSIDSLVVLLTRKQKEGL